MVDEIRPSELEPLLETDEEPVIVDIRNQMSFRQHHIPGSQNIPFQQLPQEVEAVRGEDHVVTVCPHGKASIKAARLIASFEGFDGDVESLETGITGWDGPLASDSGQTDEPDESSAAPF
ncbi:rhodanese-like domain-containing protein [Halovenus rubra]|uniref:Rhodanese-like domain-containing protein n=2 Tax=Halovenus rubra TaxID=869890 RepID=A0ABD5X8C2_9EURY|nr:rhodanese-like domain-containing protein [Halovenus rubra]